MFFSIFGILLSRAFRRQESDSMVMVMRTMNNIMGVAMMAPSRAPWGVNVVDDVLAYAAEEDVFLADVLASVVAVA